MPSAWRVHVIEQRLLQEGLRVPVSECDVYSLEQVPRTRVIDTLVAERASFPMVLVGEVVACDAALDLDAVVRAVREALSSDDCC